MTVGRGRACSGTVVSGEGFAGHAKCGPFCNQRASRWLTARQNGSSHNWVFKECAAQRPSKQRGQMSRLQGLLIWRNATFTLLDLTDYESPISLAFHLSLGRRSPGSSPTCSPEGSLVAHHDQMPTDLLLDALKMGLWVQDEAGQDVAGLIQHPDAGNQYTAIRYAARLTRRTHWLLSARSAIRTINPSQRPEPACTRLSV